MPKAMLKFDLPEEQEEFKAATQGAAARNLLWEIDQHCRGVIKYGEASEETRKALEYIRTLIRECAEVSLDG